MTVSMMAMGFGCVWLDRPSSPTSRRSRFGWPGVSRPPAPYPDAETRSAGKAVYSTSSMRRMAAPVGVTRSIAGPDGVDGRIAEERERGGSGDGEGSVSAVHGAAADVER